jgi:hypothetical protein
MCGSSPRPVPPPPPPPPQAAPAAVVNPAQAGEQRGPELRIGNAARTSKTNSKKKGKKAFKGTSIQGVNTPLTTGSGLSIPK